jgi:hypothetical protein
MKDIDKIEKELEGLTPENIAEIANGYENRAKIMLFFWFILFVLMVLSEDILLTTVFFISSISAILIMSGSKMNSRIYLVLAIKKLIENQIEMEGNENEE